MFMLWYQGGEGVEVVGWGGGRGGGRMACLHCKAQLHVDIRIDWIVLAFGQLQQSICRGQSDTPLIYLHSSRCSVLSERWDRTRQGGQGRAGQDKARQNKS